MILGPRDRPETEGGSTSAEPGVACAHVSQVRPVEPRTSGGCEECLLAGDSWVHLRLCRTCGHVGCCDSSKNRHATGHYRSTGHPIVRSLEPGERWSWCYVDELVLQLDA